MINWLQAIEEFSICTIEDKKSLLLHNLDPMFNIKSARFFQSKAENLFEQLKNFCVFDTRHLVQTKNAKEAPTLKWNQFFRTPWANSVEVDMWFQWILEKNLISIFQHEKKYEIFMNRAKEIDIDERVGCLLQVL